MVERPEILRGIEAGLRGAPVTALLGPRQCGKTTLARIVARGRSGAYFDLEDRQDLARLD